MERHARASFLISILPGPEIVSEAREQASWSIRERIREHGRLRVGKAAAMQGSEVDESEFFRAVAAMSDPPAMALPDPEALARVHALAERRLSPEEFEAYVDAPMSDAEREEILASVAWFKKRYPTPGERLAAARRAYAQWAKSIPRTG